MVKEAMAGVVAVVFALGMTTVVHAQAPAPKAEDKKPAETLEKKTEKPAEKKPAAKKEARVAKKPAAEKAATAKAEQTDEKPAPKPAEAKK